MRNIFLISLMLFFTYGCSQEVQSSPSIRVNKCSYIDEYFDYCKIEYLKFYQKIYEKQSVNFNKDFILTSVGGENNSFAGVVAINKNTGIVDTMLFGYKKNNDNQLVFNVNSDIFCINSIVNSKSYSITRGGEACFKYNKNGFELLQTKDNAHGFKFSKIPYNSEKHLKCQLNNKNEDCLGINLISSSILGKKYSFISPSFGSNLILPVSHNRKEIIISLFEEEGGPQITIFIVDKSGNFKEKTVSIQKNVIIDKDYILHYWSNGKQFKQKLE